MAPPVSGLPRPASHFTGRTREQSDLVAAVTAERGSRMCVLHGLAGVGKTAAAVRAAYAVADRFPDGTLYIDLYGYTDGRDPLAPADALERLLRRTGTPPERIPADIDERAALWRSVLTQRRLLVVLDNARDLPQIRPLLPATGAAAAIITSRRRLAALDDVDVVALDVLALDEAVQLFTDVAGPDRIEREPAATDTVARIVSRCGLLPLTVRIAAARYRTNPAQRLADLDAYLADTHTRLVVLDDEERSAVATL